jgi:ABC-2 type transport system permease protein
MNTFKVLIKREFWEHQGAVFYTPVIIALILALLAIFGGITGHTVASSQGTDFSFSQQLPKMIDEFESMSEETREKGLQVALFVPLGLFGFISLIISLFFGLGSLYDERKDRSILFWKSLPVSDTATILSKFVALSLMVPISYWLVVTAFQVFLMLYATVLSWIGGDSGALVWGSVNLFGVAFNSLIALIVASLWLAPLWGWAMLASSWAKKVPFLWALLPILLLAYAEYVVFGSWGFIQTFGERIGSAVQIQNSNINVLIDQDNFDLISGSALEQLGNIKMWGGVLVGAAFIATATYIRRYRDEA